jgi:hypothetical protein
MSLPNDPAEPGNISPDDPSEPVSYFELERRRAAGETLLGGEPLTTPLPASSPWHHDPVPAEPTIDRSDDGVAVGTPIDQLP